MKISNLPVLFLGLLVACTSAPDVPHQSEDTIRKTAETKIEAIIDDENTIIVFLMH